MIPECGQWSLVTQGGHWTAAGDRSIDPSIGRILVMQIYSGMRLSSAPLPSIRGRNYICVVIRINATASGSIEYW